MEEYEWERVTGSVLFEKGGTRVYKCKEKRTVTKFFRKKNNLEVFPT